MKKLQLISLFAGIILLAQPVVSRADEITPSQAGDMLNYMLMKGLKFAQVCTHYDSRIKPLRDMVESVAKIYATQGPQAVEDAGMIDQIANYILAGRMPTLEEGDVLLNKIRFVIASNDYLQKSTVNVLQELKACRASGTIIPVDKAQAVRHNIANALGAMENRFELMTMALANSENTGLTLNRCCGTLAEDALESFTSKAADIDAKGILSQAFQIAKNNKLNIALGVAGVATLGYVGYKLYQNKKEADQFE